MVDVDDIKDNKDFGRNRPQDNQGLFVKGNAHSDWALKSRIVNCKSGKAVMLAFAHGYFQGQTSGLEWIDLNYLALVAYADVMMSTHGVLRSVMPHSATKPVVLRASGENSVLRELENETVCVSIEDPIRLGVCAMAAQVYFRSNYGHKSIKPVIKLIDAGQRYGIPTLADTGLGKDRKRDARYLGLATRLAAEIGAHHAKSYYVKEGFARVCAACPVPIVIAGGKKLPKIESLDMAYKAIDQDAAGVDMGRNIFQAGELVAGIQAVTRVVHQGETGEKAYQMYQDLKGHA